MDRTFFEQQTEAVRTGFATGIGADRAAFDRDRLTLVERPDTAPWPYQALAVTFGLGTVASVDPALRDFAAGLPLEFGHVSAAWPGYLSAIAGEARRLDDASTAAAWPVALLWALASPPSEAALPEVPDGLQLRRVDRDWMNAEQPNDRFDNAVGAVGRSARDVRNRYALVVFDAADEPVAVAGVFTTMGLDEIGVDVVPSMQGRGLAPLVVTEATRAILEEGGTPLYVCASTNTRSQRTALASGFLPVGADSFAG